MHGGGRDIRRLRQGGGARRSLGGRLLGWLGAVGLGVSAAISPRTAMADNGDDSGGRTAAGRDEVGTESDDGGSRAEAPHPVDGLAPLRPALDPSPTGARPRSRLAVGETRTALFPAAFGQDPANESSALGQAAAPAWVGWSGASALADPEETGDDQASSFTKESVGEVGELSGVSGVEWINGGPSLRRIHPRSRTGDFRVPPPNLAEAPPKPTSTSSSSSSSSSEVVSAATDSAGAQPSPPPAHGCAPPFLDGAPSRGGAAGMSAIWPANVTLTATPGDRPPRGWLSPAIDGLGPSAPWVSLGSRTLLPRISLLLEAGHGPAGTNLTAYITASFTLDRGPLVTGARTTFARIAARHEQAAAKQTAAFARLLGQIAAARCVSAAEQEALVDLWRDAQ